MARPVTWWLAFLAILACGLMAASWWPYYGDRCPSAPHVCQPAKRQRAGGRKARKKGLSPYAKGAKLPMRYSPEYAAWFRKNHGRDLEVEMGYVPEVRTHG